MSLRRRKGLTSVEQLLVDHVRRGEGLDLAAEGDVVNKESMRPWGGSRPCRATVIRATVIRAILRGRLAADPDPQGLQLRGARISGRLDLEHLTTDVRFELRDCLLEKGILARDARLAYVGLIGCRLEHATEIPLDAERLTCSVLTLNKAIIIGHAEAGAVRLAGARIDGPFDCDGARLRNDSGPALIAHNLQVGQDMYIHGGFTAAGAGKDGAVRLVGARIDGNLECDGARLCNDSGPALYADRLHVGGAMFLRSEFTATGAGKDGAVRLVGARVDGTLECDEARLRNDSGPALTAQMLHVGENMLLRGEFTAAGDGDHVTVDLTEARVGGVLAFKPAPLDNADLHRRLAVNGLTYPRVPWQISARDWMDLLRHGTRRYAAQPYRQLAAGYRAMGDERQAREILMAQRDDQLARTHPRRRERLWGQITRITLGYGYQPWRALLFLAAVVVASCVLAVLLGSHGALAQTDKTATPGHSCTVIQRVSVGLDLNLPVGTSLARAGCDLTKHLGSATAAWLTVVGLVLRLLAWAFAALFIAGFTSAVRKT